MSGDECTQTTTKNYDKASPANLTSQCPNAIRIIKLDLDCKPKEEALAEVLPVEACVVDQILKMGDTCMLEYCIS